MYDNNAGAATKNAMGIANDYNVTHGVDILEGGSMLTFLHSPLLTSKKSHSIATVDTETNNYRQSAICFCNVG